MDNWTKLKLQNVLVNLGILGILSHTVPIMLNNYILSSIGGEIFGYEVTEAFGINMLLFFRGIGMIAFIFLIMSKAEGNFPDIKKRVFSRKLGGKIIFILIILAVFADYSSMTIVNMIRRGMDGKTVIALSGETVIRNVGVISFLITFMVAVILAPIVEEFIYRFLMMNAFSGVFKSNWLSVFIQCLIFGVLHRELYANINAFFMGIIFTLVTLWTGNILAGAIVHGVSNLSTITLDLLYNTGVLENSIAGSHQVINFGIPCFIITGILMYVIYRGREFDVAGKYNPLINEKKQERVFKMQIEGN